MARPKQPHPTPAELEVLQVLWDDGPATVRQVMERLKKDRPRGYTTVMSLLDVMILVGGLPTTRRYPFEYQAVFSPGDVIEEYTRPARFVENNNLVIRDALTDVEHHEFEGIGTLESFKRSVSSNARFSAA